MKKLMVVILIVAVGSVGLILGCAEEKAEIKIGVILPLTGDGAVYGHDIKTGVDLAAEEINKTGGIGGARISLVYEDDEGLPASAVSAFQKLITQHNVKVIIGGAFSSPALAIAPIAQQNEVVLISPTASSPKLTKAGEFVFRNWPSDILEGSAMAEFAIREIGAKKAGILYSNSEYGVGLKDVFREEFIRLGGQIVGQESFSEGDSDFRTQLSKVGGGKPDVIYMTGYYKEFAKILRQASEISMKTQLLSCVTFNEPDILNLAGQSAEGVFFTQPFYEAGRDEPVVKTFVSHYVEEFGEVPGIYAAHGYDALKIVALSIERGGYSGSGIQKAMLSIENFQGVSGQTTFDENGDVIKPARIFAVKNGEFTPFEQIKKGGEKQ